MAFRYSRPAMTGAAIFTLAGVTVLPLAQANAAPASPQDEARSGATQGQPNSAAQNGQDQGQQQSANANGQGQQGANASGQNQDGATQDQQQSANAGGQGQQQTQGGATQDPSQAASGGEQQQGQPSASQDKQGTNASGQGQQAQPGATQDQQQSANANAQGQQQGANANGQSQQAQGAPASQSSSNSNSASQNNQSRQSQPSAPANQNSGFIAITSVDGFIDPQNTDNVLSVETTGIDNTHRVQYEPRVQELDEFGNIVNDDVSNGGGASSNDSEGNLGISVVVDGTKINPNHQYRVYIDVFDQDTLTASYAYYPIVVWNRTYIPVVPLSAAQ